MRNVLLPIRFVSQDAPTTTNIAGRSWLLCNLTAFRDLHTLVEAAPGITKGADLGRLFGSITSESGDYSIEIGAILPDWIPNLEGQQDYCLDVDVGAEDPLPVCFSNQMLRVRYFKDKDSWHALVPRFAVPLVKEKVGLPFPEDSPFEFLRTVATARFHLAGNTAEDAVEEGIEECIGRFMAALNRVLGAMLMLPSSQVGALAPTLDRNSLDYFYVIVADPDGRDCNAQRLAANAFKVVVNNRNYSEDDAARFLSLVNGSAEISDINRIIHSGKAYMEAGLLEFALLQLVIASEILTTRFVHRMLIAQGAAKKRLKDVENDLTFSLMLNLTLFALCPASMKPNRALVGSIDRARDKRNKLMHRGQFDLGVGDLRVLYESVKSYRDFLNSVLSFRGMPPLA